MSGNDNLTENSQQNLLTVEKGLSKNNGSLITWDIVVAEVFRAINKHDENEEKLIKDLVEQLKHKLYDILIFDYKRVQISQEYCQAGIYEIVLTERDYENKGDFYNLLKYQKEMGFEMRCKAFSYRKKGDVFVLYFNPDEASEIYESQINCDQRKNCLKDNFVPETLVGENLGHESLVAPSKKRRRTEDIVSEEK